MSKEYYTKNKERLKKYNTKYYQEHLEILKTKQNERVRNRYKNDPMFKMVCNLRSRLRKALKAQGAKKDISSKELFGANQESVWKHLESQFKEGMTRENYCFKGWHIDHIKPFSSFDLNDPEQLKECNHYTNLQPLWWWENFEKSDKIICK